MEATVQENFFTKFDEFEIQTKSRPASIPVHTAFIPAPQPGTNSVSIGNKG